MAELVKYEGEVWSALYVDGKLDRVGDHYVVGERIEELAGVRVVQSEDFLRGGNKRSDVAPTLEALLEYSRARQERLSAAARLRSQAEEMISQAEKLESGRG